MTAGIFVIAVVVEAIVEYFVVPLLDKVSAGEYARYAALVVGIALCTMYKVDLLQDLVGLVAFHPIAGYVLSGCIVGRGSNYLNDFVDFVRGLPTRRV